MFRSISIAACSIGLLASASVDRPTSDLTVSSTVREVTIYHTGALVQRSVDLDIPAGTTVLSFDNISVKILLNTVKLSSNELNILNRSMVHKLAPEERQRLRDERDALTNQLTLLEGKYSEVGFIKDVAELEKMMALYSQRILEIKRQMRSVEDRLSDENKLDSFNIKNPDAGILRLTVSTASPIKSKVGLSYLVGGIGWSPSYDLVVEDVASAKINLKYNAKIMSQTGEDWDNVKMNLSSEFPLAKPKELPKPDGPWVLNEPRGAASLPDGLVQGSAQAYEWQATNSKSLANAGGIQDLVGVAYDIIRVPTFLENRQLEGKFTLKSNSTVFTYPILDVSLPARFYHYGYPSLDPEAYLVAEINDWESYGFMDAVANIRYKGNDAGRSTIRFSESTGTLLMPIGQDNSVYLNYEEIADEKYFKEVWASKKMRTTMAYSYKVKNNNGFPIEFRLIDQVPIAQQKSDQITIIDKSDGSFNDRQGEVTWIMNLNSGELVEKKLIYTVESENSFRSGVPAGRMDKKARYKGVASPRFM